MAYKNERRRSENDVLAKQSEREMPFLRINFILMAIAGVMIVLGFLLMAGGSSDWGCLFFTFYAGAGEGRGGSSCGGVAYKKKNKDCDVRCVTAVS